MKIAWADALDYQNGARMKRGDAPGILEALELADGRDFACFFRVFKQFSCNSHPIFTPKNDGGGSFLSLVCGGHDLDARLLPLVTRPLTPCAHGGELYEKTTHSIFQF